MEIFLHRLPVFVVILAHNFSLTNDLKVLKVQVNGLQFGSAKYCNLENRNLRPRVMCKVAVYD